MFNISTGEPSTLGTYRKIALAIAFNENNPAVQFFDKKIKESPNGENEMVIAHETQMILLIGQLVFSKDSSDIITK